MIWAEYDSDVGEDIKRIAEELSIPIKVELNDYGYMNVYFNSSKDKDILESATWEMRYTRWMNGE